MVYDDQLIPTLRKVDVKKNSSNRGPAPRRKGTRQEKQESIRKQTLGATITTHNRLADSYNAVCGLHDGVVESLTHVTSVTGLITHPDVKEHLTPEVEHELSKSLKVVIDGVKHSQGELQQLTRELNGLNPDPKNVPKGQDAADRNMEILTMGSRYGAIMERHDNVTLPAVATCVDLVNSVLPEGKKLTMGGLADALTEVRDELEEEMKDVTQ